MAEEAIARAKELDEYFRRTGNLVGPLVGSCFPVNFRRVNIPSTVFQ